MSEFADQIVVQSGNAVIRFSAVFDKKVADLYTKEFKNVLKDKTYTQEDVPTNKEQKKQIDDKRAEYEKIWEDNRDTVYLELDGLRNQMNTTADSLKESLNETEFTQFQADIEFLNCGYFKEDIPVWSADVVTIHGKIDEKNATAAEKERKDKLAAGKHDVGMYKVGTDIPAGEYEIVSTLTTMEYVSVTSNASHKLSAIGTKENFDGERYITLKEGQYVTLKRCKIVQ